MEFGEKLRILRQEQGLTQAEVAKEIGISRRAYVSYEQQGARPRKRDTYEKLASTLGCDINDLLMEHSGAFDDLVASNKKVGNPASAGIMAAGAGVLAGLGTLALPMGFLLSPAAAMAGFAAYSAFSAGKKKDGVVQAAPISSAKDAFQSFERSQKRFSATSMGLIYGRLAEMGIPFHPEFNSSMGDSGNGFDAVLNLDAPGIGTWWLCFWSSSSEGDSATEMPFDAVAKALFSRFLCNPPDPRKKSSIVVDNDALFDALFKLKGFNSYRGNLSVIMVDPSEVCLKREEYIAVYEEGGEEPFSLVE